MVWRWVEGTASGGQGTALNPRRGFAPLDTR